jgi:hypothetical protein
MVVPWSKSLQAREKHLTASLLLYPGVTMRGDKRMIGDNKYQKAITRYFWALSWRDLRGI